MQLPPCQTTPARGIRRRTGAWARQAASNSGPLMKAAALVAGLATTAACGAPSDGMAQARAPSAAVIACSNDGFDFNLIDVTPAGLTIGFVDASFQMTFEERTTASMGDTLVTLTTYVTTDRPEPMRLTLADDGTDLRARLQIPPDRDIAATCSRIAAR